jgi:hypothetical protein
MIRSVIRARPATALVALLVIASCMKPKIAAETANEAEATPDGALRAMQWFHDQRAFPGKTIPPGVRQAALNDIRRKWPQLAWLSSAPPRTGAVASAVNTSVPWQPVGPSPILPGTFSGSAQLNTSGRIAAIAVHPTNPQIIYIGAADGGVWKTINGGTSWAPLTDHQCSLAMGSIAIDPVNPQIVYAGTGEQNGGLDNYQGCGIMRSVDGGATWVEYGPSDFIGQPGTAMIAKLVVDPATAGSATTTIVVAATQNGLYRSTNSGVTWTHLYTGKFTDVVLGATPGVMYAGVEGLGIGKSTNAGLTFGLLGGGLPTTGFGRIAVATAPSATGTVYAAFAKSPDGTFYGLYRTTDGGTTWAAVTATNATCKTQCWYDMTISVDPLSSLVVYFGGFDLFRSTDGGATFTDISASFHVDHHAFAFDPTANTTIFAGSDGGIFKSTNSGTTWTSLNTNLNITQFFPGMSVHPTSGTTFIGGSQDNGTIEGGTTTTWQAVAGGDGGQTAYDRKSGATFLSFTSGSLATFGPWRRDAGSTTWQAKFTGISSSDPAEWVMPFTMDPHNPSILYFGTSMIYRSMNSGDSWDALLNVPLTNGTGGLSTIAIAPSDSETIYTGSFDGLLAVSSDFGDLWATGTTSRSITKIIVDPVDPKTAWLTLSGFAAGHVYKTVNGGASWTDISFDLPVNAPVNAIVYQRGTHELDIGSDVGVFALADGATSWVPLMTGLPNVVVTDLVYDGPRGRLVAATHGRGVWTLSVATAVLRGNITNSGTLSVADAQAILLAVVGKPLPAGAVRFPHGDANCDGTVTAADALLVLSKLVGANTSAFCVGTVR